MAKKGGKKSDVITEEMWELIEEKILEKLYHYFFITKMLYKTSSISDTSNLLTLITQIKKRHFEL